MNTLHIAHIIEASATGTLSMAALLANYQAVHGHVVTVIYSNRAETPKNFIDHFDRKITLVNIQMSTPLERVISLLKIRSTLKNISPDTVFMHSSFAGFLGRLSSLATLKNTKFFYLPHCISFMRKDIGIIRRIIFIGFEWIAAVKNAQYVSCSESERKAITYYIPFRKCHLVENALNFNAIPKVSKKILSHRKKTVITVGQIRPQKGPYLFSVIAEAVRSRDSQIEFIWVGDGDALLKKTLKDAGVKVVGWVPKGEVWEYLNDSRLYLSTAAWEGMPVSVIEASLAGLPVVASNCAGNVDVITHRETGWLFKTPEEATQFILSAFGSPDASESVSKKAHDLARRRFSVERYFREMESLIQ